MERIVSGSRDQGYDPARGVSKFGAEIVGQDAKLLNCVLSRYQCGKMSIVDVEGSSVDVLGALIRNTSTNLIVAPSVNIVDGWVALRLTLRDHSRRQRN